ncbi:hypothetical protein D3C77_242860 [compost metagenome]
MLGRQAQGCGGGRTAVGGNVVVVGVTEGAFQALGDLPAGFELNALAGDLPIIQPAARRALPGH